MNTPATKQTGPGPSSDAPTVVFLHAHPDDEAIFTGGTIRRLADAGHHITLICATSGEGGRSTPNGQTGKRRQAETEEAGRILGIDEILFLGFTDSGIIGEVEDGFAHVSIELAAKKLVESIKQVNRPVAAMVTYDSDGIYRHPDHIQVHRVGQIGARLLGVECIYEATVDREYLHFVETHLVVEAGLGERPENYGLAATHIGRSTLEISTTIDVEQQLDLKRAAMAAHASQLPPEAGVFGLDNKAFAAVYGQEWYIRSGPAGVLDTLGGS